VAVLAGETGLEAGEYVEANLDVPVAVQHVTATPEPQFFLPTGAVYLEPSIVALGHDPVPLVVHFGDVPGFRVVDGQGHVRVHALDQGGCPDLGFG